MRKEQLIRGKCKPTWGQRFTITKAKQEPPARSWWQGAEADGFTARAVEEVPRMRVSKFASVSSPILGGADPGLKKRKSASAWVEYEF